MKYFLDTKFLEGKQERPLILKGRLGNWMLGYPKPTIDLISIGIVSEDGREYYAISKDFNLKEAWNRFDEEIIEFSGDLKNQYPNGRKQKKYWLRDNVLRPIYDDLVSKYYEEYKRTINKNNFVGTILKPYFSFKVLKWLLHRYGKSNSQIAQEIIEFTEPLHRNYSLDGEKRFTEGWVGVGHYPPDEKTINNYGFKYHYLPTNPEFYAYYADYDWVVFCWLFGKMMDLPKGFPMYCRDLKQMLDEKIERINLMRFDDNSPKVTVNSMKKNNPFWPKQENEHTALHDARWNKNIYFFLKDSAL